MKFFDISLAITLKMCIVFFYLYRKKKDLITEIETLKNQYVDRENEVIRLQELLDRGQSDKIK